MLKSYLLSIVCFFLAACYRGSPGFAESEAAALFQSCRDILSAVSASDYSLEETESLLKKRLKLFKEGQHVLLKTDDESGSPGLNVLISIKVYVKKNGRGRLYEMKDGDRSALIGTDAEKGLDVGVDEDEYELETIWYVK